MLREHELAAGRPAGAGLAQLAQDRVELARRALVEAEALHGVLEHVGRVGEHRPPVARRAGGGAGLGHRVAVAEEHVVHDGDDLGSGFASWHLVESWHRS